VKEEEHRAEVFLNPEEVSLAIGKGGANIKLASMLTGYNIEVFRDIDEVDEEDIYLDEFRDEIDGWVIDQLKKIGCSTAKNVPGNQQREAHQRGRPGGEHRGRDPGHTALRI